MKVEGSKCSNYCIHFKGKRGKDCQGKLTLGKNLGKTAKVVESALLWIHRDIDGF